MIIQNFLASYAYIWVFIIAVVLIWAGLKKIQLPGNDFVIALTSVLISFLLISSTSVTNYLVSIIPFLALITTVIFFILILLVFVTKDFEPFKKPIAWISFILAILIIIALAFNQFSTLYNVLPGSSNTGLSDGLVGFKNFIYSTDFRETFVFVISLALVCFFILKKK